MSKPNIAERRIAERRSVKEKKEKKPEKTFSITVKGGKRINVSEAKVNNVRISIRYGAAKSKEVLQGIQSLSKSVGLREKSASEGERKLLNAELRELLELERGMLSLQKGSLTKESANKLVLDLMKLGYFK